MTENEKQMCPIALLGYTSNSAKIVNLHDESTFNQLSCIREKCAWWIEDMFGKFNHSHCAIARIGK